MASPDGNPMMDKTPECPASGGMPARHFQPRRRLQDGDDTIVAVRDLRTAVRMP